MCLSFVSGVILARNLGPEDYGDFNFLLGSFAALINLVDMATSSAFFTLISKKARDLSFHIYYFIWCLVQFLFLLIIVKYLPQNIKDEIWLGNSDQLIILSLCAGFSMRKLWQISTQIGESIRDTFRLQIRNLSLSILYFIAILYVSYNKIISVEVALMLNAILYLFFSLMYLINLFLEGKVFEPKAENSADIFKEFKVYCAPLVLYTIVGFFYTFLDYWLLQYFGGSIEQGYYSVGYRFSAIVIIATTSVSNIFWKEISEEFSKRNIQRVRYLYKKVLNIFSLFGLIISGYLVSNSSEILDIFYGPDFVGGKTAFALMLFYPVYQSAGQISSTMLLAIGKTKAASLIGISFMVYSLIICYLFLAPNNYFIPGLSLGSTGLALKMIICQIAMVNLSLYYISKYIDIKFDWKLQFLIIPVFIIGILSKYLFDILIPNIYANKNSLIVMFFSGLFYLKILVLLANKYLKFPVLSLGSLKELLKVFKK